MATLNSDRDPIAYFDELERLLRLPDQALLTTAEAAIFLRGSVSALEAMRARGSGPTYMQNMEKGATGGNQKCLYQKEDLLAWIKANKVTSTVAAAVRKGQLFMSAFDLANAEAFWIDGDGRVVGMVEAAPVAIVVERLGQYDIVWLSACEAAGRTWRDLASHQAFGDQVLSVLRVEAARVEAGLEATEIAAEARPASPGRARSAP